jgi:hypothetical protein
VGDARPEPIFTPRLQIGFGLLAFGIGLMFLAGKVLPHPIPLAIAGGIALALVGFVVVVVEALREPPAATPEDEAGEDDRAAPAPPDRSGRRPVSGFQPPEG